MTNVETITPAEAAAYLDLLIRPNRLLNPYIVQSYARDMTSGHWYLTGDPIRFDTEGRLIDGQHRLKAAVLANVPFESYVIRDLPTSVITVLDSGRKRTAGDLLAFRGHPNGHLLSATCKWMLTMKAMAQTNGKSIMPRTVMKPSYAEIVDIVEQHPELAHSCQVVMGAMGIRPSVLAAIHYVGKNLLKKQEDGVFLADAFVKVFTKGIGYWEDNDPAIRLRDANIRDKLKGKSVSDRIAIITSVYAWNHFSEGKPLVALRPPQIIKVTDLKPEMI